jgi:hypothetical protein
MYRDFYGDGTGSYGDGRGYFSYSSGAPARDVRVQLERERAEWEAERGPRRLQLVTQCATLQS